MIRALLAMTMTLCLIGCGPGTPVTLKTVTLQPVQLSWNDAEFLSIGFWCGIQDVGLGPSFSSGAHDILSGFEDFRLTGSGPFECVDVANINYRGGCKFDLSQFASITAATLTFDVESSISSNGEVVSQVPPACNATTLGMATGADLYDFDNPATLPPCGPSYRIGVSSQARDWIDQSHANFGFILAGPRLGFASDIQRDNSASISWYSNFRLQVLYNPALNPHALQ